jgi:uncharacterized protein
MSLSGESRRHPVGMSSRLSVILHVPGNLCEPPHRPSRMSGDLIPTAALLHVLWFQVPTNVLGGELRCCCRDPLTGFYRDGYCRIGSGDVGLHTVCAQMTNEFLEFSYSRGNDLVTPQPGFPGLKEGDRWCLCVTRWHEALEAGAAPPVDLHATHASTLEFVTLEELQAHALT